MSFQCLNALRTLKLIVAKLIKGFEYKDKIRTNVVLNVAKHIYEKCQFLSQ